MKGDTPVEKLQNCWDTLQVGIDGLMDKDKKHTVDGVGLKQVNLSLSYLDRFDHTILQIR